MRINQCTVATVMQLYITKHLKHATASSIKGSLNITTLTYEGESSNNRNGEVEVVTHK